MKTTLHLPKHPSILMLISGMIICLFTNTVTAQNLTQTIRGEVRDKETKETIIGASVVLVDSDPFNGTITNTEGIFVLNNVPVGRQSLQISFMGYKPLFLSNLVITSAKELQLMVEIEISTTELKEVVVSAYDKNEALNKMASISARSFSIDETQRYAGSWGDPARMVSGYGGVIAVNDTRNDIVIRGNSPVGLIWKLEGIPIPNPNHFATSGATGGAVSILNNNTLSNSDFYTAAFPAEYGNGVSGVFDLNLRKGNNQKREYLAQASFFGLEAGAEGPFSKNYKGSYMLNYRYSTLGAMDKFSLTGGLPAIPKYQDLCMKLHLPTPKCGTFTVFGIGGLSNRELLFKAEKGDGAMDDLMALDSLNQYIHSDMGVIGISNMFRFSGKGYVKTKVALTGTDYSFHLDTIAPQDIFEKYLSKSAETKIIGSLLTNYRINPRNVIRAGITYENNSFRFLERNYENAENNYRYITNYKGYYSLINGFIQYQHKFSDRFLINQGVYAQYFDFNDSYSIEPRFSLKYQINEKQDIAFGAGLHSQTQPMQFYLYETHTSNDVALTNKDMEMSKSFHSVLGYNYRINSNFRIKSEAYYQYLFNIPVESHESYFSMVNVGADYSIPETDSLVNKGTGQNIGMDFTFEKFFSNNYYFLLTASLYDSKYTASDNIKRNTVFNGNYSFSFIGGYELPFKTNNAFIINSKLAMIGNKRYIPINIEESQQQNRTVFNHDDAYSNKYDPYIKLDINFGFRSNRKKVTHHFLIDITNVLNRKNVFTKTYDPEKQKIVTTAQYPFMPNIIYRLCL